MQRSRLQSRRARCAHLLLAALLAPGCIILHRPELPLPEIEPAPPQAAVIEFEVGEIRLLDGDAPAQRPVGFEQTLGSRELANVLDRWHRRGWIRGWGRPKRTPVPATHRLSLTGTQREEYPTRWDALCGTTLGLIPSRHRVRYEWTFTLEDLHTLQSHAVPVRRSRTTWFQWLLLPVSPVSLLGVWAAERYQAEYLYRELTRRGAWTDSAPERNSR